MGCGASSTRRFAQIFPEAPAADAFSSVTPAESASCLSHAGASASFTGASPFRRQHAAAQSPESCRRQHAAAHGPQSKDTASSAAQVHPVGAAAAAVVGTLVGELSDVIRVNEIRRVLGGIFLFNSLSKEQMDKVIRSVEPHEFKPGSVVVNQGEEASHFWLIQQGSIGVFKDGERIRRLLRWDYFGERGLLRQEKRSATCRAEEDCVCFCLHKDVFGDIVGAFRKQLERRMKLQDVSVEISDLRVKAIIGRGSFGVVRLVCDKGNEGVMYALKCINKQQVVLQGQELPTLLEREINLNCYHPCIMQFFTTFQDASHVYFLTEFLGGGDLFHTMREIGNLTKEQSMFYAGSITLALEYLHARSIMYRDLKPENVLLDLQGYAKLVDFGCCKKAFRTVSLVGTTEYTAPETILGTGYTCSVDWWALGVMMHEFIVGPLPFGRENTDRLELLHQILEAPIYFPPYVNDESATSIICGLLERNALLRLGGSSRGALEIKEHLYFASFDWDALLARKLCVPWVPDPDQLQLDWEPDCEIILLSGGDERSSGSQPGMASVKGDGKGKVILSIPLCASVRTGITRSDEVESPIDQLQMQVGSGSDRFQCGLYRGTCMANLGADDPRAVALRETCYSQKVLQSESLEYTVSQPDRLAEAIRNLRGGGAMTFSGERNRHGSQYGELIEGYIKEGKIVPVEITVKLIQQAMESSWEDGKFLIDGFPRSFDNMEGWENVLGGKVDVKFALFFDCSEACMEARIMERGKTSGRVDDNAEAVKKRFRTFQQESLPVVELLQSRGLLRKVSSEKSVEEVWEDVRGIFGPSVVFVLGGPGKCQGTVCERITENFGYTHLSAGDLLREERARPGSKYGELIESHIKEGKLVPADITVKLLQQAMELHCWEGGKYLIDGFPRSFDNLESWDRNIKDQVLVKFILYMDCSSGVMEARLLERGKTSGRADDNIESIKKRFVTFHKESTPVVEKFAKEGKVKRIDAEQSRDVVWSKVQAHFGPSVVFVLGGPGAGKGTQCQRISDMFSYKHLSAGDLLREERNRPGSEYGDLINSYIKDGKIVPVDITVSLLQKAMMTMGWEGGRYLIDGFPRSFDNLEGWYRVIGNKVRVKSVLFFDVSEPVMEARLLERGKTSGRVDDNLESIRKRFITFQQESMPVVEKFRSEGLLRFINAEQSEEMVWNDVRKNFGPSAIFVLGGPGAGKGTQCTRIAAAFGFSHLSAGDLLREERARPGSQLGELISSNIKEGKLVPVEITVQLLQKAMEERGWEDGKYLIDGFPRSFANMEGWNKILADKVDVKCCLFFGCTEAEMEACCTGENSRKQHLAQRNQC
ncbi:unnamed protein product [Polarella glacialis]|uniref:UMP-CMP kinase n=1 Tax=Polarella glacialis TaxID=89957 RepID=A0A813L3Q6_POLGL|nr:unnamed protein product [Polarella glacialis]